MELDDLAKQLKSWERAFHDIHGRKPGKADVDQAPKHIRDCYRRYWNKRNNVKSPNKVSIDKRRSNAKSENTVRLKKSQFSGAAFLAYHTKRPLSEKVSVESNKTEDHIFGSTYANAIAKVAEPSRSLSHSILPSTSAVVPTGTLRRAWSFDVVAEPLGGILPKITHVTTKSAKDVLADNFVPALHLSTPFEIATKRQNLSNLVYVDPENETNDSEHLSQLSPIDLAYPTESTADEIMELMNSRQSKPKADAAIRRKSVRPNTNFVRVNMKHKRYQSKASKQKSNAAKKFLRQKKFRQQRRL